MVGVGVPPPTFPTVSLLELLEVVSDVCLRFSRVMVLADINVHVRSRHDKAAQDFVAPMATLCLLSQYITGLMYQEGHNLELVFCLD